MIRGDYTVRAGQAIDDNVKIYNGTLRVNGEVDGSIEEYGADPVVVGRNADVNGNVFERRDGRVAIRGHVDGNVQEAGGGNLLIYATARIFGDVSESGPGRIIRY